MGKIEGKIEKTKLSVDGLYCNLSGLENKASILYENNNDLKETSAYTLDFIARTLEKITQNLLESYGKINVIYAGGVMSSQYLRKTLSKYGYFADAAFSADNAVGTALLAAEYHERNGG